MDLSKTLFVIPPTDDKFLCTYHGGLMDIPIENNCSHCFCSFCIESLTHCPIDGCEISESFINEQLKDEIDQLLCYCQFGVEENPVTGEITTKINGCSCVISYGSKIAHESVCKYNPVNEKSPSLSYQDFYEMKMSGSDSSSKPSSTFSSPSDTSPKSSNSTSKSPSFEFISSPEFNINNSTNNNIPTNNASSVSNNASLPPYNANNASLPPYNANNGNNNLFNNNSINNNNYNTINQLLTTKLPSSLSLDLPLLNNTSLSTTATTNNNNFINNNNNENCQDYYDNNALWESSTSLFFCNRFCPNKDLGCCYTGKTEQDINYHLQIECYCQKMKEKIYSLEKIVEEKDQQIKQLRTSDSKLNILDFTNNNNSCNNNNNSNKDNNNNNIINKEKDNKNNINNNNNNNNNKEKDINNNNNNNNNNSNSTNNKNYHQMDDEDEKKSNQNNKQIQTYNFSKIFVLLFNVLKKGIKKSIKKVKKFFKRKNSNGPYKNFIKIK